MSIHYILSTLFSRKDFNGNPSKGFLKENALTRVEALKGMTIWVHIQILKSLQKGVLTGKYADFVILTNDIMEVPENEIKNISVVATIVNGSVVFQK